MLSLRIIPGVSWTHSEFYRLPSAANYFSPSSILFLSHISPVNLVSTFPASYFDSWRFGFTAPRIELAAVVYWWWIDNQRYHELGVPIMEWICLDLIFAALRFGLTKFLFSSGAAILIWVGGPLVWDF